MIGKKVTFWAHEVVRPYLEKATILVDGTMGNGQDTLFLRENSLPEAKVYSFDIQPIALEMTGKLLEEQAQLPPVELILGNHRDINAFVPTQIDVGMLNLGYLPQGNKEITTMTENTISTLGIWLNKLSLHGMISVVCYPGHVEGEQEYVAISNYLSELSGALFQVARMEAWNRKGAPIAFFIERIREGLL